MSVLIIAGLCLAAAQVLGIYGLATRKADLIFAVVMVALLLAALLLGLDWAYHRVH